MTFDIHREAEPHTGGSAFEPLTGGASRVKKSLRSRSGGLLTSTALVSVGFALVAGSAAAQAPEGYAPAPPEVVSYVQLSNGSVLVQLANNQSLLVTSNNYFIDSAGVLYLSPSVGGNISGGGAPAAAATAPLVGALPAASNQAPPSSTGVLFDDTAVAANSGGMMAAVTGGPGLFGLGTLGTIAAVALGTGALVLGVNAIRSRLEEDDPSNNSAALTVVDNDIVRGESSGSVSYTIADADGVDQSNLKTAVENAVGGASTVASIFPNGATVVVEGAADSRVDGTTDTYASLSVTVTGDIAAALNVGSFPGPSVAFTDAKGNAESVNFALDIAAEDGGSTSSLELDQADGSTHQIAQGGSKLFKATDPEGDNITYGISNNPSGIGIDSNTGLVVVASSVATGSYTITVTASSTGADGTVDTDTETYNITVTEGAGGSGGSSGNVVNADFDSASAGFNTLTGINTTDGDRADSGDNEFEVVAASHLANSFIMDGLAGDDTVYFSEAGATYHLDPTWENGFEDVSGFETLALLSGVNLEINGGVLDSESTGDIEHIQGSGDNIITLVNRDAEMGLDVAVTNVDTIDLNGYDLTIDHSDLSQIDKLVGDGVSALIFSGQFTYDFAEGLVETQGITRLGLDGGNYSYVLNLDGINDEDLREISADTAAEIEGDVVLDTRENSKITLIDLAGDENTTGGLSGDSNIFATYDDELTILGGSNDDDVDMILDSDVDPGDFLFDGGADGEDTLNVNLNGEDLDTLGHGRSINNVEFVDVDAPDGDGEARLEFWGNSVNNSTLRVVDVSDVKDKSTIALTGDLSNEAGYRAGTIDSEATAAVIAGATSSSSGAGAIAIVGRSAADAPLAAFDAGDTASAKFVTAVVAPIYDGAINIIEGSVGQGASFVQASIIVDGWVSERDTEVSMTEADDTITLTVGETELDLIIDDAADMAGWASTTGELIDAFGAGADADYGVNANRSYAYLGDGSALSDNNAVAISSLLVASATAAPTGTASAAGANHIIGVRSVEDGNAEGAGAVTIALGGGDDEVDLTLGGAQTAEVSIEFSRAPTDDINTITIRNLEDFGGAVAGAAATETSGVRFDFADDVLGPLVDAGTVAGVAAVSVAAVSQHQSVIVFNGLVQRGIIYDHDGDGTLSDGDTLVDLTQASGGVASTAADAAVTSFGVNTAGELTFMSTDGDTWNFKLDNGDLADLG